MLAGSGTEEGSVEKSLGMGGGELQGGVKGPSIATGGAALLGQHRET